MGKKLLVQKILEIIMKHGNWTLLQNISSQAIQLITYHSVHWAKFHENLKCYFKKKLIILSENMTNINLDHGNIIRTGITCKKISCYTRGSA